MHAGPGHPHVLVRLEPANIALVGRDKLANASAKADWPEDGGLLRAWPEKGRTAVVLALNQLRLKYWGGRAATEAAFPSVALHSEVQFNDLRLADDLKRCSEVKNRSEETRRKRQF
jgi:hypothetical protein